ncbi:MAG: MFS transporter [Acidobacteriota bacterium]
MNATIRSSPLSSNRAFLRLFGAQAVSLAGSGVTTVALALLVRDMAGSAAAAVILGQVLSLRILAFLLFSQPAGLLADRVNRKWLLVGADVLRFLALGTFPFIHSLWQVYVAVFVVNALTAFFTPAYEASLPEVAGENYTTALAYSRVAIDMEAILGPVLAGVLVSLMGLHWVFLIDAASYLVSAALVLSVDIPRTANVQVESESSWRQLSYGTRLLFREPDLRKALIMSVAESIAGACAIVITVVYVRDVLARSTFVFSWTMAAVGVGSSVAAVVLSRRTTRQERGRSGADLHAIRHRWARQALLTGGIATILSLIGGVFNPPLAVFVAFWLLNGAGQALIAIPSSTLVAEHTSAEDRGRAFGAHFAWTHVSWLFAYPFVGFLASRFGAGTAFSICGLACLLVFLTALAVGNRHSPKFAL